MHWGKEYRVWEAACPEKDTARPVLQHALVERVGASERGLIVAADGFILAVVPCTLEDDDATGLVDAQAIKAAAGGAANWPGPSMVLGDEAVTLAGGITRPRCREGTVPRQSFPDWRRLVRVALEEEPTPGLAHGLNPFHLRRLALAVGYKESAVPGGISLLFTGSPFKNPIILETCTPEEGGFPAAPFGLLMPVYSQEAVARRPMPISEADEALRVAELAGVS